MGENKTIHCCSHLSAHQTRYLFSDNSLGIRRDSGQSVSEEKRIRLAQKTEVETSAPSKLQASINILAPKRTTLNSSELEKSIDLARATWAKQG